MRWIPAPWLWLAIGLVAVRFAHLGGPLDDPHSWRQCDTAFYTLDFVRNGIDLLRPAVCWLGAHRTLVLEFPLPEAIAATLGRAFGADPMWDRVVALAFFIVSAVYFHRFVRLVGPPLAARLATLAYLALPLGQYYSRAAHVDFAAIACAHGLLYHATRASASRSPKHAVCAAGCGALAAAIKAPCLAPVLGPLALAVLLTPSLASFALTGLALGVSGVAFVAWRRHVDAVNAAAPDWYFLPGYYKESNPMWWYVGRLAQRFDVGAWKIIVKRVLQEVLTPLGAAFALAGLAMRPAAGDDAGPLARRGPLPFALLWALGAVAGMLVFFPLNVIHNYYQLPLLAPASWFIGMGAELAWRRLPRFGAVPAGAVAYGAFVVLALWSVVPLGYYHVDWLRVAAGRAMQTVVPAHDLVVVADHNSGYSDPRLLYRSDRVGWPLAVADLTPGRLDTLAGLGARWVAVVTDPEHPDQRPPAFLESARAARVPLTHGAERLGELHVFRLDRDRLAAAERRP